MTREDHRAAAAQIFKPRRPRRPRCNNLAQSWWHALASQQGKGRHVVGRTHVDRGARIDEQLRGGSMLADGQCSAAKKLSVDDLGAHVADLLVRGATRRARRGRMAATSSLRIFFSPSAAEGAEEEEETIRKWLVDKRAVGDGLSRRRRRRRSQEEEELDPS